MKLLSYVGLLVGLSVLALLVAWQGVASVAGTLASSGWGLLLLPVVWLPHLVLGAVAWRLLFLAERAPTLPRAVGAEWIGRSVNTLLPVASIGGEVVKARVVVLWGARGSDAGASVVVDKTVQAITLLAWGVIGIGVLLAITAAPGLAAAALAGLVLFAAGIAGFVVVQRAGAFGFLARSAGRLGGEAWRGIADSAGEIDAVIRSLYARPGRIALSCAVLLTARVLLTAEVWLAAYLMGFPITLGEALMLKSLSMALRGAAFVVPNGYGVQEGGFVLLGALVGQPPELMLSLSLAVRVRELLVSVPGMLAWQQAEGRALWKRFGPGAHRAD